MTKRKTKSIDGLVYYYDTIQEGESDEVEYFIFAVDRRHRCVYEITMSIPGINLNNNYVLLPDDLSELAVRHFYEHFVEEEVGTAEGSDYDPCNIIVRLKDNWKDDFIKIKR